MEKQKQSVNDLIVTYGVAVVSVIMALALGSYVIAGAIAMFTKNTVGLPSILAVIGGGGVTSLMVSGIFSVLGAVVAMLAFKKITTSPQAGDLVSSNCYDLTNKFARAFCFLTAMAAGAAILGVLLALLLSISDYTPWGARFLDTIMPLAFVAVGLALAGVLIGKFVKAEIKPNVLSAVSLVVAIIAAVIAIVAILVSTHVSSSSTKTYQPVHYDLPSTYDFGD